MRYLSGLLILCSLFFLRYKALPGHEEPGNKFDLVIYGGTPAGMAAAIQVARSGKSVALIEPSDHIGGIMINGLGGTDIDNHSGFQNSPAIGGIALEFYRKIAGYYDNLDEFESMLQSNRKDASLWQFEPHVAENIIKDWINEYSISVFFNRRLRESSQAVIKDGTKIIKIEMEDGELFEGKVFIDATIEGDLLYYAGVTTIVGRESNDVYNETKNGIRKVNTHGQFQVKVDPYKVPGDPSSGTLPTVKSEPFGEPGDGDNRIQGYNFRLCLTKQPENKVAFEKPQNYNPQLYELYLRFIKAGGQYLLPSEFLPNHKSDFNGGGAVSHNLYGMNYEYPGGNYKTRERIIEEHKCFTQGLLYFLANDPRVPEKVRSNWIKWGLCKDEFADNNHWPRQFYVRDARRMVSDYVITEHHTRKEAQTQVEDPVGSAFWPTDVHHVRRIVKDGAAYNEGFVFNKRDLSPFGVSYRAMVPKKNEVTNLITPTCPSSSHIAYGAIRIEWTFMVLGQSAALAAGLAIERNCDVQKIPYAELQDLLIANKQKIFADEILK